MSTPQPDEAAPDSYEHHLARGRRVVLARGVPVLPDDALILPVPREPAVGEFGAVAFARDIAVWLSRLFDRTPDAVTYRESQWDRRPCPRVQVFEVAIAGHVIQVIAYDVLTPDGRDTLTAHAIAVDAGPPTPFTPHRPARHLDWQLACAAWRVTRGT
jgi:hypothetical protein